MAPPVHLFRPLPSPSPSNDNAAAISKLFRDGGPGTTVLLVPRAVYPLYSSIDFVHPMTTLATDGYPSFESGNQAIIETRGEKEAIAVRMFNHPQTALKRLHVRGCRGWGATPPEQDSEKESLKRAGKLGWLEGGGALVWMGGPDSYDSIVEGCRLEDPRGWTALHLVDFAQRCKVINNIVGPCGQEAPGPWADGLSIAGKDSLVSGNTIVDATDGAIVLFCAPGTVCTNNTIIARQRNLLGAINMVDEFPFERNFEQTRVIGNKISTEGAYIRLGIGCGTTCWGPWAPNHGLNFGGSVLHNYLGPGQFGYGIALSGTRRFAVLGNSILPGTRFAGSMQRFAPNAVSAPPTAFVRQWRDRGRVVECDVQDEFVEGEVQWLIGIEPEVGDKLEYEAGQISMDASGRSRAGEGGIALRRGRWEVGRTAELLLRQVSDEERVDRFGMGAYGEGKVLWTSGSGRRDVEEPHLDFHVDGALTLRSKGGRGDTLWNPTAYLAPFLSALPHPPSPPKPSEPTPAEQWLSYPKLILQAKKPYLQLKDHDGNVLYSTSYDWSSQDGWAMRAGQWLVIAPEGLRGYEEPSEQRSPSGTGGGPPPVPVRPEHHGGHFGRFVRDISSSLQQHGIDLPSSLPHSVPPNDTTSLQSSAPPIPSRLETSSKPLAPTFLFFSPHASQLILHSSPSGPTSPQPEHIHWAVPAQSLSPPAADAWISFQGDGNLVVYAAGGVPWASGTNGERGAERLVLKAVGEEGGPALELHDREGKVIFTSQR
ncbi:hypothetical protein JCM21900_002630 [Sporobolomyces salmonicolor]